MGRKDNSDPEAGATEELVGVSAVPGSDSMGRSNSVCKIKSYKLPFFVASAQTEE